MRSRSILCTALLSLALCSALPAQPRCSPQSLRGTWSMSFLGWAIPLPIPGSPLPADETLPLVGLSVVTVDHTGKFTGPATAVTGGVVLDFEMKGKMEVNADCSGIVTYGIKLKGSPDFIPGYVERFVLDLNRHEIVSVSIQSPLSKPMWITTMKRISHVEAPVTWPAIPVQN